MPPVERATPLVGSHVVDTVVDLVAVHGGAVAVVELNGVIHRWSAGAERLFGYPAAEVIGRRLSDVTNLGLDEGDIAETLLSRMDRVRVHEHTVVAREGGTVRVRTSATAMICDGVSRMLTASFPVEMTTDGDARGDVVHRPALTPVSLQRSPLSRFEGSILEAAHDGIWVTATDGRTIYANTRMATLMGYALDDLLGKHALDCFADPRAREQVRDHLSRRAEGESGQHELPVCAADGNVRWLLIAGSPVRDAEGVHTANLAVCTDITERKMMEDALSRKSLYDELTGLPNRALFRDRLAQLQLSRRDVGLILLDLDHFHTVNVRHRPAGGDLVMQSVAMRLAEVARDGDTVARLSGDEFAILCPESEGDVVRRIAAEVSAVIEEPFVVEGHDVFLTASVGFAVDVVAVDDDGGGVDVVRAATTALCEAKAHGGARVEEYDESMAARTRDRVALMSDLRRALERQELHVAYQPVVQLDSGRPVGMEALLRWTHPQRGPVSPAEFIPLAEDAGLMPRIGAWVLGQACRDAAAHASDNGKGEGIYVAVNFSAHQFVDDGIVDVVRSALRASGLPAERLTLEVTETAVIAEKDRATQTLNALCGLGVRVAIDDFGTGYSSLDYLRQFPADTIKIDRSFVARVNDDEGDQAIVASLLSLAGTLGVRVIAEGVETGEQLHLLRRLGCSLGQGFLWSPAVPASELLDVLERLRKPQPNRQRGPRAASASSADGFVTAGPPGLPVDIAGRIMALRSAGSSPSSIAAALNAAGVRSPRGTRWHRSTVARVIAELSFPSERLVRL